MAPPTVSVQGRDGIGIVLCCLSILHTRNGLEAVSLGVRRHDSLLIDPGIGTVPKPAAGPS